MFAATGDTRIDQRDGGRETPPNADPENATLRILGGHSKLT